MEENKVYEGTVEDIEVSEKSGIFTRIGDGIKSFNDKKSELFDKHPVVKGACGVAKIAAIGAVGYFIGSKMKNNPIGSEVLDVIEAKSEEILDQIVEN